MSRNLPEFPNLDHLKKQAKAVLRELKQQNADAKLTDAQYAVARKYGFASWTKLKAYVEAQPQGGPPGGTPPTVSSQSGDSNPGLFVRFTMRCRRVIFFARYFAGHQGATNIEPVHLLRGLVEEDGDRFKHLLKSLRVDPSPRSVDPEDIRRNAPIPLAAESKRMITLAAGEADRLGSLNIATGHFWLACLAEENREVLTALHRLLRESGTSVEKLRQSIERNLEEM